MHLRCAVKGKGSSEVASQSAGITTGLWLSSRFRNRGAQLNRSIGFAGPAGALIIFLCAVVPATAQNSIGIRYASYGFANDRSEVIGFIQNKCGRNTDCEFRVIEEQFPPNLWDGSGGKPLPDLWVQFKCRPNGNLCSFHTHWEGKAIHMSCRGGTAIVVGSDENGGGCYSGKAPIGKNVLLGRR
jgi:hypothetical protein